MSECRHDLSERETAVVDGLCPQCLQASLLTTQSERDQARKEIDEAMAQINGFMGLKDALILCEIRVDTAKIRADAAEQQVRSLEEQVQAKDEALDGAIRSMKGCGITITPGSLHPGAIAQCEAALSPRRES